jgi:hypothetical protein
MAESFEITGPALNRAVYVSIASVKDDPQLDVLAGITFYTLQRKPNLTTEQIGDGIVAVGNAITESSPDLRFDQSPNESMYMSRILTRLVPKLTDPDWRDGSREYTRAFLGSYRRGVNQFRQVASIESQFDQFGEVDRFRRDIWERLHEFASQAPSAATALNQSSISERLGAQTSDRQSDARADPDSRTQWVRHCSSAARRRAAGRTG